MKRKLGRHSLQRLTYVLRRGGCIKPEETARSLLTYTGGGDNQSVSNVLDYPDAVASSTMSERLGAVDLRRLLHAFNHALEADAAAQLKARPPDNGQVIVVVDGHDEEYYDGPPPSGAIPLKHTRWYWKTRTTSDNKATRYGHKFLFVEALWWHRGIKCASLLLVHLLHPLELGTACHVQLAAGPINRLKAKHEVVLLDRYYDSNVALREAEHLGLRMGVRMRLGKSPNRTLYLDNGRRTTVWDVVHKTASMPLPIQEVSIRDLWSKDRKRVLLAKSAQVHARLWPEGPVYSIVVQAVVKPAGEGASRHWALDPDVSMVLCFPQGTRTSRALQVYRQRSDIETFFSQSARDRASARAKTIESFVVQYLAYIYRIQVGLIAQTTLALACPDGKFRGRDLARYPAFLLSRVILGISKTFRWPSPGMAAGLG